MWTQQVRRSSTTLVVSVIYAIIAYPLLASEQTYLFDVSRTSADIALNTVAQQADVLVLFPFDKIRLIETNELSGVYTLADGLRFILEGTGISAHITEGGIMRIEFKRNQFRLDKECRICVMPLWQCAAGATNKNIDHLFSLDGAGER